MVKIFGKNSSNIEELLANIAKEKNPRLML
jgi:hypothetical protein